MNIDVSVLLVLSIGVVSLLFACRMLFRQALSGALLKVILGLSLFSVSLFLTLGAVDLLTYRKILDEQLVATLRFEEVQPQRYKVVVVDADGNVYHHYLLGDDWQLDARIIRWHPTLAAIGFSNNYRLDRLSGRYQDITREVSSDRTVYQLTKSHSPLDLWAVAQKLPRLAGWIDARYGSATYLPMAHGAAYQVSLGYSGLVAKPLNENTSKVVESWEQ